MHLCSFTLNDQPTSAFEIAGRSFRAFSGLADHANKRRDMCVPDHGPIPIGTYYIVDRRFGGRLGRLYEAFDRRSDWFALYADDGRIDDETFCNGVSRGHFRLHPAVGRGLSKGCITIQSQADFNVIKGMLRGVKNVRIPGTDVSTYGKVIVR